MALLRRVGRWLFDRLGLHRLVEHGLRHPVPRANVEGRAAWMYVLGFATLGAFGIQVVTGIFLVGHYEPYPAGAHESLVRINEEVPLGALLRGVHYFGASAMMILIGLHALRVFLTGSYKYPREMNWLFGVVLLLLTVLMAATGQLLRWDQDGMWTVSVGAQLLARVPLLGEWLAQFVLAGDRIGGATLSRFFAFHVLLFPLLLVATVSVHLYLVLHHGVSEPPEAGEPVDPDRYRSRYRALLKESPYRYWPHSLRLELIAVAVLIVCVVALAWFVGPKGPGAPPDPTTIAADPRPDWYFRWYYALLAVKPRGLEMLVMVYLPLAFLVWMIVLPLFSSTGERHPVRRPWAIVATLVAVSVVGVLTEMGIRAPWAMRFETEPIHAAALGLSPGPATDGARVFHERGCQYCHAVAGRGGVYGPDLTRVTHRLPPEIVVARTLNGIRDMPAYQGILEREEMAAILAFLQEVAQR